MHKQWPPWEVTSSRKNLALLHNLVQDPRNAGLEAEPLGWLCRLLIIRSCGYLEKSVVECARGFVTSKSGGLVKTFALTWLEKSRNPTPANMLDLAGRFDPSFREDFARVLDLEDRRLHDALCSLVDKRNKIAHGVNEGITRDRTLALHDAAIELSDWWILRLNPY